MVNVYTTEPPKTLARLRRANDIQRPLIKTVYAIFAVSTLMPGTVKRNEESSYDSFVATT